MPRRSPSKSPAAGQTTAAKRATRGSVGGSPSPRAKPPAKATPPVKAAPPAKATPPVKATPPAKATPAARGRSTGRSSSKAASPSKKRVESASPARRGGGTGGGASPPKKGATARGGAGQQKKKQAVTAKSPTAKRGASAPRGGKRGGKGKQESEAEEEEEEDSPAASPKKSKGGRSPRRASSPAKPPTPSSGRGKAKQKTPTPSKTKKPKSPSASGSRKRKGRADSQLEAGSGKKKVKLSELAAAANEEKDEKSGEGEDKMEVEQRVEQSNTAAEAKEAESVAMTTDSSQLANKEVEPGVKEVEPGVKEAVPVVKEAEPVVKEAQDGVDSLAMESGFVVIGQSDVPPANSAEVLAAIPPVVVVAPPTDENPTSTSGKNPIAGGSPARSKSPASSEISKSVMAGNSPTSSGSPTGRGGAEANSSPQTGALINGAAVGANGHSTDMNGAVQQTAEGLGAQAQTKSGGDKPPTAEPPHLDELFSRRWIANPSCHPSTTAVDRSITLVSYNVLADCHAGRDYASAPWLPPGNQWSSDSRHDRLIAELMHLDADIICLQEVGTDYFVRRLQPALGALGYEGVHYPRTIYPEGEATFCRQSRLSLLSHRGVTLKAAIEAEVDASPLEADVKVAVKAAVDTFAVALLTRFKVVGVATADQSELSVANIHCAWEPQDRSDRQCLQVASTMRALVEVAGGPTHPHIICGDFNSTPSSAPYQLMHDGHLSDKSLSALQAIGGVAQPDGQMAPLVNYWSEGFQYSPSSNMKSAYLTVTREEPLTARMPHNAAIQAVDYIWFSANALECSGVLATVARDRWEGGVPNPTFPSDHQSLKAKLVFK